MIANDNSNNETLQSLTEQMNAVQTSLAVLEKEETDLQNSLVLIQHSVYAISIPSYFIEGGIDECLHLAHSISN